MTPAENESLIPSCLQFASYRIFPTKRILLDGRGETVELTARAFDLLLFLITHQGQVLSKSEIMDAIWPGSIVEENNLNQAIFSIRKALADDGSGERLIVTVPRRGYSFVADVGFINSEEEAVATAQLNITSRTLPRAAFSLLLVFVLIAIAGFINFDELTESRIFSRMAGTPQSLDQRPIRRYSLNLGASEFNSTRGMSTDFAISPDGSRLAYFLFESPNWNLYLRELDELESRPLNASAVWGVEMPGLTFSSDGESLLYYNRSGLTKIALQLGAEPEVILKTAMLEGNYGATWFEDEIFFIAQNVSLHKVPAAGGESTAVSISGIDFLLGSRFPHVLPDGEAMLLTVSHGPGRLNFQSSIALLDTDSDQAIILLADAGNPRYVNSGHILFMRSGSLWAVPFDLERKQIVGEEVELPYAIEGLSNFYYANYTVSDDGQFIYQPASDITPEQRVEARHRSVPVWVDRNGQETPLDMPEALYFSPHLSKGDQRLAVRNDNSKLENVEVPDIWSYEFDRDSFQRLTYGEIAVDPQWTPDGQHLAYRRVLKSHSRWLIPADGSGEPQVLTQFLGNVGTFSPDGKTMVFLARNPINGTTDLHQLTLVGESVSKPLLESPYSLGGPRISPSGRWIAYWSRETGRGEIYVRPYPNIEDGKWQISTNWGVEPEWREDEGELYYRQYDSDPTSPRTIWAVPLQTEPELKAGIPQALFTGNYTGGASGSSFDVNESGDKFLMLKGAPDIENETDSLSLNVVENWFEELSQLVPRGQD